MPMIPDTCQVCRLPFGRAALSSAAKLEINGESYRICWDCLRSLRKWLRTREEVGLEEREKRRDNG